MEHEVIISRSTMVINIFSITNSLFCKFSFLCGDVRTNKC